jgi:hypothetical protein
MGDYQVARELFNRVGSLSICIKATQRPFFWYI